MFWIILIFAIVLSAIITVVHSFGRKQKRPKEKKKGTELARSIANPIIKPRADKEWEKEGTFNPTALLDENNRVHLVYRSIGADGVSRFGYAGSEDGVRIDDQSIEPIFSLVNPREGVPEGTAGYYDPIMYPSGGSWGGCEDPRMTKIDDRIYITFNAFDGWDFIRVAVTSIDGRDFKLKKWSWRRPIFISPKKQIHKNWVLFPEKINGKFAILHSVSPEIQIDYVDKLEDLASGKKVINSKFGQNGPRKEWDSYVRGAGPSPIKTPKGWLILYHAIDKKEPGRYKLGAMLLDFKNPKKIIARSPAPLLMPDKWYENDWKPGIVYACGAIVKRHRLFVYYGGGDKYTCVASALLEDVLNSLVANEPSPRFVLS